MNYRKPVVYIPPYNYCDRWCDGCAIDKSRCLLYQTEMDERLHRQIDGLGEPTPEEMIGRIVEDAKKALRLVEDQVREMGMDPRVLQQDPATPTPRKQSEDPIVAEAALLSRGIAALVRAHGAAHPREAQLLRRSLPLPAPKLGRATLDAGDEMEEADGILQAQVAHRALVSMAEALESMRRRDPSLGDAMLDVRALLQRLAADIEERWLSQPCELLEPVDEGAWWGPVRDVTPTLRHFRR
ncbi:MAG TPA: hypothetical protein VKW04_25410 [Planctomycetota bacterium]|nr:hypothetical protein [Planctomycetota bacterium]